MVPEQEEDEELGNQPLELEDMLELFREDEEPPRKGFNPMWLVLALVVVVGGCWLASIGLQAFVGKMSELQGGGPKAAKATDRAPESVPDLQADYGERCRKGMTKDEVRWIIGDFQKARLGPGPGGLTREIQNIFDSSGGSKVWNARDDEDPLPIGPDLIADLKSKGLLLAKAQQDWYVDALAYGLHLDAGQIARAKESGREFIDEKGVDFLKYSYALHSNGPDSGGVVRHGGLGSGEIEGIRYVFPESGLLVAEHWMADPANAPWKRCELRPEQLAVTALPLMTAGEGGKKPEEELSERPSFVDSVSNLWGEPGRILAFMPDQYPARDLEGDGTPREDELIRSTTKLHPAQFKLVLLCHPDLVEKLMPLLEKE